MLLGLRCQKFTLFVQILQNTRTTHSKTYSVWLLGMIWASMTWANSWKHRFASACFECCLSQTNSPIQSHCLSRHASIVLDIDYANSWKQCFSVLHLCCKLIVYSVVLLFSTEQRHFVWSRYPRRQTHMSLWNLNRVASIHFADTVPVYWVLTTNIHWYKSL